MAANKVDLNMTLFLDRCRHPQEVMYTDILRRYCRISVPREIGIQTKGPDVDHLEGVTF